MIYHGDCLDVLAGLPENSVDTCITDPPYELGFMGKKWDNTGVAFQPETWAAVYRVLKPGAILLAFGGTRTYHRLACAIEDAGFEIRDTIAWVYGSGFPKSYDISKGIDKQAGAEREVTGKYKRPDGTGRPNRNNWKKLDGNWGENSGFDPTKDIITAPATEAAQLWHGWGTALKPAFEPIVVAMKPIDGTFVNNALTWGVAGLNIDGGRVEATPDDMGDWDRFKGFQNKNTIRKNMVDVKAKDFEDRIDNGINPQGRFPANVIHDGSDEVVELFPDSDTKRIDKPSMCDEEANTWGGTFQRNRGARGYDGNGSAARFFYCAKASRSERNAGLDGMPERRKEEVYGDGLNSATKCDPKLHTPEGVARRPLTQNHHPTVKPLALMRYLVRLTKTPAGGVVLDPFMGSGTTGIACVQEGRDFIGIEREAEYIEIAEKRIEHAQSSIPVELPLFEEIA